MLNFYDSILIFGPFVVAYAILATLQNGANLDNVLKHFLNYAPLAILGILLSFWNRQLEQRGPDDPDAWIALVAFTFLSLLAAGFALANFWIGWRAIGDWFKSAAFARVKIWSLRAGYVLLLLNIFFLWRYADTPLSK
jgi:hypothetical protein